MTTKKYDECKYAMPGVFENLSHILCNAYSYSHAKLPDGSPYKFWLHYPPCEDKYCLLRHPELLKGATLETD